MSDSFNIKLSLSPSDVTDFALISVKSCDIPTERSCLQRGITIVLAISVGVAQLTLGYPPIYDQSEPKFPRLSSWTTNTGTQLNILLPTPTYSDGHDS